MSNVCLEDRPPTILFNSQIGPIAQTADGKLLVYPNTILHLVCLYKRKNGTPHWSWSHAGRAYQQGRHFINSIKKAQLTIINSVWSQAEQVTSLEYRLTLFHAQERDSGVYTCQTPDSLNSHSHSVEVVVKGKCIIFLMIFNLS